MIGQDFHWRSSNLKAFHACPRKFRYQYLDGFGEAPSNAQLFGTAIHAALEQWLLAYDASEEVRLAVALAALNQLTDPWELARARAVILGYDTRWGGEKWRVLAVEQPFAFDLEGNLITGTIDAIVQRLDDGRVFVLEHKTSSADTSPGSAYWEQLAIDQQISIYCDGAAMLGYEIDGVIYDVLVKPKHTPLLATPTEKRIYTKGKGCKYCGGSAGGKRGVERGRGSIAVNGVERHCLACNGTGWGNEGKDAPRLHEKHRVTDEAASEFEARILEAISVEPDAYYRRAEIARSADDLPAMRRDVLQTIAMAKVSSALGLWPRNTGNCRAFHSTCFYLPLCSGAASPETDVRYQPTQPPAAAAR